jgi:octaheme c-type cytochrome (tetrathionate reductase family)
MEKYGRLALLTLTLLMLAAGSAAAVTDHAEFIKGPFKSGPEVTRACLECHTRQAEDFMKTSHWTWKGKPRLIKGMESSAQEFGKANMINNFCISVEAGANSENTGFCARCHAGYGWIGKAKNFDFTDKTRVDCLICHASAGGYLRANGAGPDPKSIESGRVDLLKAAQSVGKPTRKNCGDCHFAGGGGDAVKHGDLDSTMEKPVKSLDVHMGSKASGGQDMSCQECHKTSQHKIAGAATSLATYSSRVSCEDCHSGGKAPHLHSKNGALLNKHLARVACQTCHIPVFAKGQATKMRWDWSHVGEEITVEEQFDQETFAKHKGSFVWNKDVVPQYAWYDGKVKRYMKGDRVDPAKTVYINMPVGNIKDKAAKIYPFKLHTGKQPIDSVSRELLTPQTYQSLWVDYQWDKALREGVKGSGQTYSGKYQFVETAYYGGISHEVVGKERALQCGECHLGGTRLDWQALGYQGDPMRKPGTSAE